MSETLIIAEKPSVAATIAAALGAKEKNDGYIAGNGYLVSWCVGHLVQLAEAAAYGEQYKKWSYDSLPILPQEWQYAVASDKGKQFKILKDLMHRADVSEVVNACDAGREGELIFRFVYDVAGCKKPMRRLWISSMEESAIKAGFASLKDGKEYDPLYSSALCRAKADWIIGINMTRLFSCLYGKTLNVGRVQTPTLKMLVDRDAAITTFKKEKYYHVCLSLSGVEAASAKIHAAEEAGNLKAACEAAQAVCTSVTREEKTVAPPKLFDLTSLQREANKPLIWRKPCTKRSCLPIRERTAAILLTTWAVRWRRSPPCLPESCPLCRAQTSRRKSPVCWTAKRCPTTTRLSLQWSLRKPTLLRCRKASAMSLPLQGRAF